MSSNNKSGRYIHNQKQQPIGKPFETIEAYSVENQQSDSKQYLPPLDGKTEPKKRLFSKALISSTDAHFSNNSLLDNNQAIAVQNQTMMTNPHIIQNNNKGNNNNTEDPRQINPMIQDEQL